MSFQVRRLDSVCAVTMGQAPPGEAYNDQDEGWPLIAGAGDFSNGRPAAKKYTSRGSKISAPGDVILGIRASIGEKVLADGKYCLGRGVAGLRPFKEDLDVRFLWHWLTVVNPHLVAKGRGATFKQVNREDIGELLIPLPGLTEQRRIAEVLDRADELRAKRRETLAHLDELTQSIFLDMFGEPERNAMGWPAVKLGDVLSMPLRNGLSPASRGQVEGMVLTLSSITGRRFDSTARKPATFLKKPPPGQTVDPLDFLICRGNGNLNLVGRGFFPHEAMPDTTFPDTVIAARVRRNAVRPSFLQYVWRSKAVRKQIESAARTTNGTYKINQQMLEKLTLIAPPLALQDEFGRRIGAIEENERLQSAHLASLDAVFASLQDRAFRGLL